jgi:hypothetical protein
MCTHVGGKIEDRRRMSNPARQNRKKDQRISLRENVFAALRPHFKKLGKVNDISLSGLSFDYISNGSSSEGHLEVDLFGKDKTFYLGQIKCRVVSDSNINDHTPLSSLRISRLNLKFENLTDEQRSKLKQVIQNFAQTAVHVPGRRCSRSGC